MVKAVIEKKKEQERKLVLNNQSGGTSTEVNLNLINFFIDLSEGLVTLLKSLFMPGTKNIIHH